MELAKKAFFVLTFSEGISIGGSVPGSAFFFFGTTFDLVSAQQATSNCAQRVKVHFYERASRGKNHRELVA